MKEPIRGAAPPVAREKREADRVERVVIRAELGRAVRGDSRSPHSTKISVSGPAPSRAAAISAVASAMARASFSRRRVGLNGPHLKPVKPRRTASRAPS